MTADDFGAAREVNEAVEIAHTCGVLSAASLMVGGAATGDAVARAKRLPNLRIGLHVVLIEGKPTLDPSRIPDLVDQDGMLRTDMAAFGVAVWLRTSVRRQVAAEIEAQFEAFAATGLVLDHVNAHRHFHVHPTIASMLMRIGPRFGMRAMRSPVEPRATIPNLEPAHRAPNAALANTWSLLLRKRLRSAGIRTADRVFGTAWSGAMTASRLTALMSDLREGVTEIYTHPASAGSFAGAASGYCYVDELAALQSSAVAGALAASGATTGGYLDAAQL